MEAEPGLVVGSVWALKDELLKNIPFMAPSYKVVIKSIHKRYVNNNIVMVEYMRIDGTDNDLPEASFLSVYEPL